MSAENLDNATPQDKVREMSAFIVVAFRDPHRAAEVLTELHRREWDWVADLEHAVVSWNPRGKLRVQLDVDPSTREAGAWAHVWGSLLHTALLAPNIEGLIVVAGRATSEAGGSKGPRLDDHWWRKNLRISSDFIRDVGAMVQPGDSALFMFLENTKLVSVLKQLRNYGGTVLHSSLSLDQEQVLKGALSLSASK
jgi:uncharacterized membrane protein